MARSIEACARCGSVRLKMRTIHDGGMGAGYGGIAPAAAVCQDCDWQGTALLFEDPEDWQAFRAEAKQ